uniref:Uncharacterized protein n=1 Tax=Oryza barthii TaxID=65489 RepID=A0A0D3GUC5_9ORYZ
MWQSCLWQDWKPASGGSGVTEAMCHRYWATNHCGRVVGSSERKFSPSHWANSDYAFERGYPPEVDGPALLRYPTFLLRALLRYPSFLGKELWVKTLSSSLDGR